VRKICVLYLIRKKWPCSQNKQSSENSNCFKLVVCASEVLRGNLSTSVTGSSSLKIVHYAKSAFSSCSGLLFIDCIQIRDKFPVVSMEILHGRSCNEPKIGVPFFSQTM